MHQVQEASAKKLVRHLSLSSSSEVTNDYNDLLSSKIEYELVLACNEFISEVDEEIFHVYRAAVVIYSQKFPELESLIPNKIGNTYS